MGGESGCGGRFLLCSLLPHPHYEAQIETLPSLFQYSAQNLGKELDSEAPVTKVTALLLGSGFYCHCCNFLPPSPPVFLIFFLQPYYVIFKISQISISFFPPQYQWISELCNLDHDRYWYYISSHKNGANSALAILLQDTYPNGSSIRTFFREDVSRARWY